MIFQLIQQKIIPLGTSLSSPSNGSSGAFVRAAEPPLFASNEAEVSWLVPQREYRPTDYLQRWVRFWFDEDKRLIATKAFQRIRLEQIKRHWLSAHIQREDKLEVNPAQLLALLDMASGTLDHCHSSQNISAEEAKLARQLYKLAANTIRWATVISPAPSRARELILPTAFSITAITLPIVLVLPSPGCWACPMVRQFYMTRREGAGWPLMWLISSKML